MEHCRWNHGAGERRTRDLRSIDRRRDLEEAHEKRIDIDTKSCDKFRRRFSNRLKLLLFCRLSGSRPLTDPRHLVLRFLWSQSRGRSLGSQAPKGQEWRAPRSRTASRARAATTPTTRQRNSTARNAAHSRNPAQKTMFLRETHEPLVSGKTGHSPHTRGWQSARSTICGVRARARARAHTRRCDSERTVSRARDVPPARTHARTRDFAQLLRVSAGSGARAQACRQRSQGICGKRDGTFTNCVPHPFFILLLFFFSRK